MAFDGDTARALHDEDLEADTDFCAMCGHDWCAMRISKEIRQFASGKAAEFQPDQKVATSAAPTDEQRKILAQRSKKGKLACHSDNVRDAAEARRVQAKLKK